MLKMGRMRVVILPIFYKGKCAIFCYNMPYLNVDFLMCKWYSEFGGEFAP